MPGYGRNVIGSTGIPVQALADLEGALWKVGGITIDWSSVTAVAADTTLLDGNIIKNGFKYLRYGQVMCEISTAEAPTIEFTGGATAGSAIVTFPTLGAATGGNVTIPFNATAAAVEALLATLYGDATAASVSRSGAGSAGSPYIYTVTFNRRYGDVTALANVSNTFTGGTTPSVTLAAGTAGAGTGLYGPYDSAASDGRQTLTRGQCFVMNETLTEYPTLGALGLPNSTIAGGLFNGGTAWKDRLLMTSGTASLAAGPTVANFETAFPMIDYAL